MRRPSGDTSYCVPKCRELNFGTLSSTTRAFRGSSSASFSSAVSTAMRSASGSGTSSLDERHELLERQLVTAVPHPEQARDVAGRRPIERVHPQWPFAASSVASRNTGLQVEIDTRFRSRQTRRLIKKGQTAAKVCPRSVGRRRSGSGAGFGAVFRLIRQTDNPFE